MPANMAARSPPCAVQTMGMKSSSTALFTRTPLRRTNRSSAYSPIRAAADDRTVTLLDYGKHNASLETSLQSLLLSGRFYHRDDMP